MDRLVSILVIALETMFALGLIGSFMVLALTSIEDIKTLFHGDKGPSASKSSDSNQVLAQPALSHK